LQSADPPERHVDTTDHPPFLERLFTESVADLARYFARRHDGAETVRDLVQETFLEMARGLQDGRTPRCARGYLFGIARHLSQAVWSRHARERTVPIDASLTELPAPIADPRMEAARETIAALPPMQREILDLRFAQALSYAEIAEALGIPLGTVRSRLHHAVATLCERLHDKTVS